MSNVKVEVTNNTNKAANETEKETTSLLKKLLNTELQQLKNTVEWVSSLATIGKLIPGIGPAAGAAIGAAISEVQNISQHGTSPLSLGRVAYITQKILWDIVKNPPNKESSANEGNKEISRFNSLEKQEKVGEKVFEQYGNIFPNWKKQLESVKEEKNIIGNDDGMIYGTVDPNDPSRATGKIPSSYLNPNTSQTTFGVGFGDDTWDFQGYIDQFTTLRETSKEAFSGLTSDIRTTNTQAWQPFSDSISNASYKFSNELTPAGGDAFTVFDDGLGGLGTGFGTMDTAATNLFNLTGTGFGNSLVATQNYQENGLDMLGLSLGSQLHSQLGIFQSSHDTAFGQMQDVTSSSYTKMGLAAHDFFDDVGFQASSVLGGLVTGEIDSLEGTT